MSKTIADGCKPTGISFITSLVEPSIRETVPEVTYISPLDGLNATPSGVLRILTSPRSTHQRVHLLATYHTIRTCISTNNYKHRVVAIIEIKSLLGFCIFKHVNLSGMIFQVDEPLSKWKNDYY